DRSVVVVYNGEIYNFQEVRKDLIARGYRFKTSGDTEIIVHGWREWGTACVQRFRGMFSLAVWDDGDKTLFLARDRLGIKPMYVATLGGGGVLFGSELKALLAHRPLARKLRPEAVEDYFAFGYIPDPKCILRDVQQLAPGHYMLLRRGEPPPQPQQYWRFELHENAATGEERDWQDELIAKIEEAVTLRMVSEVPLGAFLSGGVDSSTIVAMMARGVSSGQLKTCSISFDDARFNEAEYAREVASSYRTDHFERTVSADDFGLVDTLGRTYDEPFADPSAIPTYRLCQLARERVTVALSGDGADEMLAGYTRYRFHMAEQKARQVIPGAIRRPLFGFLGAVYPKADWAPRWLRAKSTFQSLATDTLQGYFNTVSLMGDDVRGALFSADFRRDLGGYGALQVFRDHLASQPQSDPLSLATFLDVKTYLPGDILTKVDRASMAHSLEVRVPMIDHELVEWIARLPNHVKLRGQQGKYLLKKAMEPHLPQRVLYRPKMGFSIPLASWFRGPLRERVRERVLTGRLAELGIFDMENVRKLVHQHERGVRDNSEYLWAILMFESSMAATLDA
ncbi:MAG: amidotransferase 1, exosortase A system-associated, partial [Chromatiales bacterium]|nr:amidotransferase 1, exosortase A system-associated [Chromatiales bacterium]